jgi:hypothetical protein
MKEHQDKDQAFLIYTIFCGDASKTAHALNCSVLQIAKMAEEHGWDKKVGEISSLRKSDRPGDLERAINRAINYTDAHRYRRTLQRLLAHFNSMDDVDLEELLITTTVDKAGNMHRHLSTRPFADLSAALEKAHALTYLALGDTAQDRARRKEESDDGVMAASVLNQQIIEAMASQDGGGLEDSPRQQLIEEQNKRAEEIALEEASLEPPTLPSDEGEQPEEIVFEIPPLPEQKKKGKGK